MKARLIEGFRFFFRPYLTQYGYPDHGGSKGVGLTRAQYALALARAELKARDLGLVFVWEGDDEPQDWPCAVEALRKRYEEGDGFIRDQILKAKLAPTYPESSYGRTYKRVGGWCDHDVEMCGVYAKDDESRDHPLASCGGILDADNTYRRVVEAELALEALDDLKKREEKKKREDAIRVEAKELYHEEGQIEIEDNAEVSPSEGGAYVAAWVFVPNEEG